MANQILVVQCSDDSKWYSKHVGEVFTVISEENTEYKVRQPADNEYGYAFLNFISKQDAHYLG